MPVKLVEQTARGMVWSKSEPTGRTGIGALLAVAYQRQSSDTRLSFAETMDAFQSEGIPPDKNCAICGVMAKTYFEIESRKGMSKRRKYFENVLLDVVENVDNKIPDELLESVARSIRGRNSQHMNVESIERRGRQKRCVCESGHPTI